MSRSAENGSSADLGPRRSGWFGLETMFPTGLDQFESHMQVSLNEMRRWHARGWLSFDADTIGRFDEEHACEVRFVKALAHFGWQDAWVEVLLQGLPKPYCYDTASTFYSFARRSWITLPEPKEELRDEELVDAYLAALAEEKDTRSLQAIRNQIDRLLEEADEKREDDEDEP